MSILSEPEAQARLATRTADSRPRITTATAIPRLRFKLTSIVTLALLAGCGGNDLPPGVKERLAKKQAAEGKVPQRRGIVGRKTLEVLDAPAALAAGTHTVAQGDVSEGLGGGGLGSDPLTQGLNALGGATGFLGRLPMQQWVNGEYALNGTYPTHERLTGFLNKNPQYALPMPRLSQRYAYDETTGRMLLLDVTGWTPEVGGSVDVRDREKPPADAAPGS